MPTFSIWQIALFSAGATTRPPTLCRLCLRLHTLVRRRTKLLTSSYVSSLMQKAAALGLRHLSLEIDSKTLLLALLPLVLSLSSLESLSLDRLTCPLSGKPLNVFPWRVTLTHLKCLSSHIHRFENALLDHLISQLHALEDLTLTALSGDIELRSLLTVKRFKLLMSCCHMIISAASLEFFHYKGTVSSLIPHFDWDMPQLKKAVLQLRLVDPNGVHIVCQLISAVSHVEELHLDVQETLPPVWHARKKNKKTLRRSMLPPNAEGNSEHAYFEDLLISENKEELLRKLNRKECSKRLKT